MKTINFKANDTHRIQLASTANAQLDTSHRLQKRIRYRIRLFFGVQAILSLFILFAVSAEPERGTQGNLARIFEWMPAVIQFWLLWSAFKFAEFARGRPLEDTAYSFAIAPHLFLCGAPLIQNGITLLTCGWACPVVAWSSVLLLGAYATVQLAIAFLIEPAREKQEADARFQIAINEYMINDINGVGSHEADVQPLAS